MPTCETCSCRGARSVLNSAGMHQDRMSRWILELQPRRGYYRTLVAIANKNARIAWALLAKNEDAAHGLNTQRLPRLQSTMTKRSNRCPENLIKHDGSTTMPTNERGPGMRLSSGPEHSLLTNRPVIVTQSVLPSSPPLPLRKRGSPYGFERRLATRRGRQLQPMVSRLLIRYAYAVQAPLPTLLATTLA